MKFTPKYFPNLGWLEIKLSTDVLNFLNECIKNKKQKHNTFLAGNIEKSYLIEDKNNWFFKNVLISCVKKYLEEFTDQSIPKILTKNCGYVLDKFWVNFQKKYEFNPLHKLSGVFSFVVWMKIPSSFKEECKLSFINGSNEKCPNTFQLLFINSVGNISSFNYNMEASDEGTMLFFPAMLKHQVYPFYNSDEDRISISGNISLSPDKIVKLEDNTNWVER